jgi:hypothetical protein
MLKRGVVRAEESKGGKANWRKLIFFYSEVNCEVFD